MRRKTVKTLAAILVSLFTLLSLGTFAYANPYLNIPSPAPSPDYLVQSAVTPPPMQMVYEAFATPEPTPKPVDQVIKIPGIYVEPTPSPTPKPPIGYREVMISSVYTTFGTYASQANRNNNIALAAKAIDYTIIENGGEFSFNRTVGPRTAARGYKEATIFVGEQKEQGLGGGICQVSSTVYMAAKRCGLKILERYPHTLEVPYCSREDEATVSWGILDFRFRNNTGDPIRLETSVNNGKLSVVIWQRVPIYE